MADTAAPRYPRSEQLGTSSGASTWEALPKPALPPRLRFGAYELDLATFELLCEGEPVELRKQAFDLLLYFTHNPGRVLSRDELCAVLWPDAVVAPGSLHQLVWEIRRALADEAGESRFIRTVRRRGYCFVAAVQYRQPRA